jgi:hypothetical protein
LKILQRELSSIDRSSWMMWRGFGSPPTSVTPTAANVAAVAAAVDVPAPSPPGNEEKKATAAAAAP